MQHHYGSGESVRQPVPPIAARNVQSQDHAPPVPWNRSVGRGGRHVQQQSSTNFATGPPQAMNSYAQQGQQSQTAVTSLEDHIRNLILTNNNASIPTQRDAGNAAGPQVVRNITNHLPNPTGNRQSPSAHLAAPPHAATDGRRGGRTPSRKRMNQAQRRQIAVQHSPTTSSAQPSDANNHRSFPHHYQNAAPNQRQQQQPPSRRGNPSIRGHASVSRGQPVTFFQEVHSHLSYLGIGTPGAPQSRLPPQNRRLFDPSLREVRLREQAIAGFGRPAADGQQVSIQIDFLQSLAQREIAKAAVSQQELSDKEAFRTMLERVCKEQIQEHEQSLRDGGTFDSSAVSLKCFGSLGSGFATHSSDMDLALLSPESIPSLASVDSPIPRLLEKRLLDLGYGARLLTRTRVPIIKLCEKPPDELLAALRKEREIWESTKDIPCVKEVEKDRDGARTDAEGKAEAGDADADAHSSVTASSPRLGDDAAEAEMKKFSQREAESLYNYYRRAKRLLEKFGCLSAELSQRDNVEPEKRETVDKMASAFLHGVRDKELRARLAALNAASPNPSPSSRSLTVIWIQAEGEQVVMKWQARKIFEVNQVKEKHGTSVVSEWQKLQTRHDMDTVEFDRSLRRCWNRLKELTSATVMMLSQRPEENCEAYAKRTKTVLRDLGGRDTAPELANALTPREVEVLKLVTQKFVDGIHDGGIRDRVRAYGSTREDASLAEMVRQMAEEDRIRAYESAVEKGIYSAGEAEVVGNYARIVREHGAKPTVPEFAEASTRLQQIPPPPSKSRRAKYVDALEFPKSGAGIQCDINFSNYLALHNTQLLRCYSHCDARVRPMVLFVKAWAKCRDVNTPYRGTLSSYGYVLMVLHYLANVANPPVVPNLQLSLGAGRSDLALEGIVDGYDVRFWKDEQEIQQLASKGMLTQNRECVGALLRGFFEYYSHQGPHVVAHGFSWGHDVLSLRTRGGLLSKQTKGWTGAKSTFEDEKQGQEKKEVRHRYLFAIEDPFEVNHNIARTVTHNGIVAIRDEFRRAWAVIMKVGGGGPVDADELFRKADGQDDKDV
ncbi:MAG: hypothetical protein M1825_002163 [Sarcosagium campestre]|nr:MAG: hypothetical protein M1825_002163 [Sarcosagium campestre]